MIFVLNALMGDGISPIILGTLPFAEGIFASRRIKFKLTENFGIEN